MKYPRSAVRSTAHALPQLRFEDQTLTSFAGLVIFQKFFACIHLKEPGICFGVCEVFFWRYAIPLFTVAYEPYWKGD